MNNQPIATLKNLLKQQDLILAELLGFYLSMFMLSRCEFINLLHMIAGGVIL